jgi:hypothetical protein
MTEKPNDPDDATDATPTTRFDPPEAEASGTSSTVPPPGAEPAAATAELPPPTPPAPPIAPTTPPPPPSQPWPPPSWGRRSHDPGRLGTIVMGVVLLAVGLWFFADQTLELDMPSLRWSQLWPILIIGVGAWIAIGSMRRR